METVRGSPRCVVLRCSSRGATSIRFLPACSPRGLQAPPGFPGQPLAALSGCRHRRAADAARGRTGAGRAHAAGAAGKHRDRPHGAGDGRNGERSAQARHGAAIGGAAGRTDGRAADDVERPCGEEQRGREGTRGGNGDLADGGGRCREGGAGGGRRGHGRIARCGVAGPSLACGPPSGKSTCKKEWAIKDNAAARIVCGWRGGRGSAGGAASGRGGAGRGRASRCGGGGRSGIAEAQGAESQGIARLAEAGAGGVGGGTGEGVGWGWGQQSRQHLC